MKALIIIVLAISLLINIILIIRAYKVRRIRRIMKYFKLKNITGVKNIWVSEEKCLYNYKPDWLLQSQNEKAFLLRNEDTIFCIDYNGQFEIFNYENQE